MKIFQLLLAMSASVIAGFLGGVASFSYLAGNSSFYPSVGLNFPTPPVAEKLVTTIQENTALKEAAAKVANVSVGIKITGAKGAAVYGSGLALTSDGLVAAPYSFFPPGAKAEVIAGGKAVGFEVIKRDKAKNLAILKLESSNWPTASFYPIDDLKLGQRVFLSGKLASGANFTNEGVVRDFTLDAINTNIIEKAEAQGAAAFDIEGNIMGMAAVGESGWVSVIPISTIKSLSGL